MDKVLSIKEVYKKLATFIRKMDDIENLRMSSSEGIRWAMTGGEGKGLGN